MFRVMKKMYFLGMTAIMMVGCTSEEFLGESSSQLKNEQGGAIEFAGFKPNMTRGDYTGQTAAEKLNNNFVVYGFKNSTGDEGTVDDANDIIVMDNYNVQYSANATGPSANANWWYEGFTAYTQAENKDVTQTTKYWDDDATRYVFYAWSAKSGTNGDISFSQETDDKVIVSKTKTGTTVKDKGYELTIKSGASIGDIYFSDRVEKTKSTTAWDHQPVTFIFRGIGSRLRVGFYETIPGYDVKITKFYATTSTTAAATDFTTLATENGTNFAAAVQTIQPTDDGIKYNVTYGTNNESIVKLQDDQTVGYAYNLVLGANIQTAEKLAENSAAPTYDQLNGEYTAVLPYEENPSNMLVKVDFTLTSLDNEKDQITVEGAQVVVPATYLKWQTNYAYTYIFKITEAVSGDNPLLYPITFDAVVENAAEVNDDTEVGTTTTVYTPSITTYQSGSMSGNNLNYVANTPIYVTVNTNGTLATLTNSVKYFSVDAGTTEADLMLKAPTTTGTDLTVTATDTTIDNITFAASTSASFTPTAAGTYAVQYSYTKDQKTAYAYKVITVK